MAISINKSQYCRLSRDVVFNNWLKDMSPDLHQSLVDVRKKSSCKSNSEQMLVVYNKLYEMGKGSDFETFISSKFPHLVEGKREAPTTSQAPPIARTPIAQNNANKHGVFRSYRPEILSFPQKRIFINSNPDQLKAIVSQFCMSKISTDYIIVDDYAYVEYFEQKYAGAADKIPLESRDIFQYKQKNGL